MSKHILDILKERGYLAQMTHEDEIREYLSTPGRTFYVGFDPTADSLHIGHFIPMMVMAHMQRAGHRPIALLGGGTGMIGDPSGRTDLRKMMTVDTIRHNVERFKKQMEILIDFSDGKALMLDNSEWLLPLNYLEFIRDIGAHFSVNRMLTAECYKNRMEKGLTFLEFNYMLLQAYDFYELYKRYDCRMQFGGDDQWSNIIAGIELIRRKDQGEAYGLTVQLLQTAAGVKMGKTAKGALWLDENKCSPFEFYQYWRNIDDVEVVKCMKMLTFIDMDEINEYAKLEGADINRAKERLAFEVTKIVHGEEKASAAAQQAKELFKGGGVSDNMETYEIDLGNDGLNLLDTLDEFKIIPSKSEGRRLIKQGGIYLNDVPVDDFGYTLTKNDFTDGEAIVRRGKKKFFRLKTN